MSTEILKELTMDFVTADGLSALQGDKFNIHIVECTASTNTDLKAMAADGAPHGTVLAALSQNGGRGRMGRSFSSPEGGLYLSLLIRKSISPADACLYTPIAALAVADAIEAVLGMNVAIKWVNDLFYGGKKVCGILTEGAPCTDGIIDYAVIGIGLNVYMPSDGFGTELEGIAGALLPDCNNKKVMNALAEEVIKRVFRYTESPNDEEAYSGYKARLFVLGKDVCVHRGSTVYNAKVINLNRDYTLSVQNETGEIQTLISGEISIRCKTNE